MKNILELKDFSVSLKSNNHKILNDINIEINNRFNVMLWQKKL